MRSGRQLSIKACEVNSEIKNNVFERQFIGEVGSFVDDSSNTPDATFVSTEVNYPRGRVGQNPVVGPLSTFLYDDFAGLKLTDPLANLADFVPGNDFIMRLTGFIRLDGGSHTFRARADDGLLFTVGVSEIFRTRVNSADVTSYSTLLEHTETFYAGLYAFELIYFDNAAANFGVSLELDGQIVDRTVTTTGVPSAVPIPAAGWMLLAGIGGIASMKRRKKA